MAAWKLAYLRHVPLQVFRYRFYRCWSIRNPLLTLSANVGPRLLSSHTTQPKDTAAAVTENEEDSKEPMLGKFLTKLMERFSPSRILQRSALNLHRSCVENIDYEDFYEVCELPKTFQSWFLINQLHVWMCLVRLKPEGKDGKYVYQELVTFFWEDIETRIYAIGVTSTARQLRELLKEFYGMIYAYDEGIMSHDRILAAALWRNLFSHTSARHNVVNLAILVEYVRKQTKFLEDIETEYLLKNGRIKWLPLRV